MKYLPKGSECSFKPPLSDLFFCFTTFWAVLYSGPGFLFLDIMEQISPRLGSPLSDLFFCFSTLSGLLCIQDPASLLLDMMEQISPRLRSHIGQECSGHRQRR
ncbi:hypothetical protein CEXT_139311 [Caerostris extrusa]|uniref:Uncharacterized protein n=1 Tax=Caerostris extrusa TaxID=172846 RepID=A0AAV4XV84_CAEEX|nr:hypothetical protein CEXT_139311 [Caerostris extrusa]